MNILPAAIANRLKSGTEPVIADRYDAASILFADMARFTARTSDIPADDLVQFLNGVFIHFDRLVERRGLEKIKTTGDALHGCARRPGAPVRPRAGTRTTRT